jgi:hypothetical protein
MRHKSCHFAEENGPIDNLLRARSFKILSGVPVSTNKSQATIRRRREH